MQIRQVDPRDFPAIDAAISKPFWGGVRKNWLSHPDPEKVEQTLKGKTDKNSLIIEETYLVVLNVGVPWFAKPSAEVLQELLVLRLYPEGKASFYCVPKALKQIAKKWGFVGIAAGAALSDRPETILKLYQRAGFNLQSPSVYWENI